MYERKEDLNIKFNLFSDFFSAQRDDKGFLKQRISSRFID